MQISLNIYMYTIIIVFQKLLVEQNDVFGNWDGSETKTRKKIKT